MQSAYKDLPLEKRIISFIAAMNEAVSHLQAGTPIVIGERDVELALADCLGLDDLFPLLDEEWSAQRITTRLETYDFARLRP